MLVSIQFLGINLMFKFMMQVVGFVIIFLLCMMYIHLFIGLIPSPHICLHLFIKSYSWFQSIVAMGRVFLDWGSTHLSDNLKTCSLMFFGCIMFISFLKLLSIVVICWSSCTFVSWRRFNIFPRFKFFLLLKCTPHLTIVTKFHTSHM
jgi:hypothetical protein